MTQGLLWERDRASWPNAETSRFVQAGGIRWHVQRMGEGPALLLLHGTGASTHSWRDLMPMLAEHFDVVAPDLPGHGFTEAVGGARSSLGGMSRSLGSLIERLCFAPAGCVGHSAGAAIAIKMCLERRIDPRLVVSLNGALMPFGGPAAALFSPLAKLLARSAWVPNLLARRALDAAAVERILAGTGSRLDARGRELYGRLVGDPRHVGGALAMMANWDLRGFDEELARLEAPLLLVVAQKDRAVSPAQALRVQALLPGARILPLDGLGHLAHEEDPARIAQIIVESMKLRPLQ